MNKKSDLRKIYRALGADLRALNTLSDAGPKLKLVDEYLLFFFYRRLNLQAGYW
jgi:hypothetical protein